jgi:hypothetical protein
LLKGGGVETGADAVGLDDEVVLGPVEVDLVAGHRVVDERRRQTELRDEGKEAFLEFAARGLRAGCEGLQRLREGSGTAAG